MGWDTKTKQVHFQAYLGSILVLGMTIGAVCGGLLMQIGRRKAIFMACFLGMTGISITLDLNFTALMIGRFLLGFSVGLLSTIIPRFIEETCPIEIYDSVAPTYTFSQTLGTLCAFFLGAILPAD